MHQEHKQSYIVTDVITETDQVKTLRLVLADGSVQPYQPGQFITVYFPESKTPEGKAYSISALPQEGMAITVKAVGEFSNRLCSMKSGDVVLASDPYGYFFPESETSTLVLVAAGIGITPFRSIVKHCLDNHPQRQIYLFYSNKTLGDIVYKQEFDELQQRYEHFTSVHFITEQPVSLPGFIAGRITPAKILELAPKVSEQEFLICGSISFVRDIWRGLRTQGVPEESIYTEAFFS